MQRTKGDPERAAAGSHVPLSTITLAVMEKGLEAVKRQREREFGGWFRDPSQLGGPQTRVGMEENGQLGGTLPMRSP